LLLKAIEGLRKAHLSSKTPTKPSYNKQQGGGNSKSTQHTYLAVASTRLPNPSLVIDLAHLELTAESWPSLEFIYNTVLDN
jgi:hypothetical protein